MSANTVHSEPNFNALRRWVAIAFFGAAVASLGDFLMLWKGLQGMREHASIVSPPAYSLLAGYYLGLMGLPLYAFGYWGISRTLKNSALATVFLVVTVTGVVSGTLVHSATGLGIYALELLDANEPGATGPFVVFASYLMPLVVVSVLATFTGTGLYVYAIATGRSVLPRWAAVFNPVILMGVLVCVALLVGGFFGDLLAFAAPNVAHVLLFGVLAIIARR